MSSEPVYMSVATSLMKDIAAGKYPIGASLPTERELCDVYQISRHTARESLRQLEQRGLISRRQGSGSTVVSQKPSIRYEQSVQSIDDLLQHGNQSRLEVLSSIVVDNNKDQFTREIALISKKPCIRLNAIRYARNDARPLAIVTVYIATQSRNQSRKLLDRSTAAREIVAAVDIEHIGRVEQALSAVKLNNEQSNTLQVRRGEPAMRTLRHYFSPRGALLVIANSFYRGDLYTYMSTLKRA